MNFADNECKECDMNFIASFQQQRCKYCKSRIIKHFWSLKGKPMQTLSIVKDMRDKIVWTHNSEVYCILIERKILVLFVLSLYACFCAEIFHRFFRKMYEIIRLSLSLNTESEIQIVLTFIVSDYCEIQIVCLK